MSTHQAIDRICACAIVIAILASCLLWGFVSASDMSSARALGYENLLFDTSKVHTIDIVMDDWDSFIANCEAEEYVDCAVVIDGESMKNVSIRAKGNTSLSNVRSMNSQRYSFKIEFDHNQKGRTYHGLDKLCLNNLIQDNTMMKDFLSYEMMRAFGVNTLLCSYVYVRVNGEDWGLYLAVESVEDSFLSRNYGSTDGDLYKPDSMSFGAGRGNGMDFNMDDFDFSFLQNTGDGEEDTVTSATTTQQDGDTSSTPSTFSMPGMGGFQMPSGDGSNFPTPPNGGTDGGFSMPFGNGSSFPTMPTGDNADGSAGMPSGEMPEGGFDMMSAFGFGSSDVKLQYTDDDPASYSNIFNNAKT